MSRKVSVWWAVPRVAPSEKATQWVIVHTASNRGLYHKTVYSVTRWQSDEFDQRQTSAPGKARWRR